MIQALRKLRGRKIPPETARLLLEIAISAAEQEGARTRFLAACKKADVIRSYRAAEERTDGVLALRADLAAMERHLVRAPAKTKERI